MTTTEKQTTKPQRSCEFALRVWSLRRVIFSTHPNPKPHLTLHQTETGEERVHLSLRGSRPPSLLVLGLESAAPVVRQEGR